MRVAIAGVVAALMLPGSAIAGRWAVGVPAHGMAVARAALPAATVLVPGRTLVVVGSRPNLAGARYIERLDTAERKVAFANTEPYAAEQWNIDAIRAWTYWADPPQLHTVRVAVIDSGLDANHPDFLGRVAAGRSFVGSPWTTDADGHGTFVAGEIAADAFNHIGIAGAAFNAELLVAKVVDDDGSVSLEGEIQAIHWAVNNGARVINLSLGGVRDPLDHSLDSYSPAEADAVAYAYSRGAVVVAAVGNGPQSPTTPWSYADYPAALPHVLGVGAIQRNGVVPDYSNRDETFLDLTAPGAAMFSTIPRALIDAHVPQCLDVAYSNCGPSEFRGAIGTSFAAPEVSAAAALVLGANPDLSADQVVWLLERSAADQTGATGCTSCSDGHDALTGWGLVDVAEALRRATGPMPVPDGFEPNDGVGRVARQVAPPKRFHAAVDWWDDVDDVYAVFMHVGDVLYARVTPDRTRASVQLTASEPLTAGSHRAGRRPAVIRAVAVGKQLRVVVRANVRGTYYVCVTAAVRSRTPIGYAIAISASRR